MRKNKGNKGRVIFLRLGNMEIIIEVNGVLDKDEVITLYRENEWSSADKPKQLMAALESSHSVVTAKFEGKLIGLGSALSDGHLVVYYPHLLVKSSFQGRGVGAKIMKKMSDIYSQYHQQILVADGRAVGFYESVGFVRAGKSEPMWIYEGNEH